MFTIPRVNVVASDEGFSVEVLGMTGLDYSEGGKSMLVDSEILTEGHGIAVYKNSIKAWRPPHEREQLTAEDKQRIIGNICRAFDFRNEPVAVH
jgi:hypothetical protein